MEDVEEKNVTQQEASQPQVDPPKGSGKPAVAKPPKASKAKNTPRQKVVDALETMVDVVENLKDYSQVTGRDLTKAELEKAIPQLEEVLARVKTAVEADQ